MANGHGGRRPGTGRKKKPAVLRAIDGGASKRPAPVIPTTNSDQAITGVEEFDAPDSLGALERAVWMRQAPYAFRNRTLTRATAMSFERYCRLVVLEAQVTEPGGSDHRGLLQRLNALELQFMLTPCGKALYEPAGDVLTPQNPLERFLNRRQG